MLAWSLLFVIPGIVAAYRYSMATYIMAENPNMQATEAIERSKALLRDTSLTLNEIAQQLAVLNDQLVQQAVRRRKVIRYAFVGVFAAIFVLIGAAIGLRVYTESQLRDEASLRTVRYECTLDGESYVYEASYNSQYQILYEGGDAWISNHVRPEQYEDVNVLSAQMQDYFEEKGGTCTIIDENP